jgi:CRP-like cAMP-binding protein
VTSFEAGSFLARLTAADLSALERVGTVVRYEKGREIFAEGADSDHVVALTAGRVKITSIDADGRESLLAVRAPGDLLGELSAIDKLPRSANAYALEIAEAIVVDSNAFTEYLRDHPTAAFALLEILTSRLRESDRRRIEFGSQTCLARVAGRLLELHERFGESSLRLSQEELASWVGATREATAKALAMLRSMGVINTARRRVEVLDAARLQALAG